MRLNTKRGFTLVEILVASAIFVVIFLAVYLVYETNQITFAKGERDVDIQQNARVAMDRIVRELRMAGFDPQVPTIIPNPCATPIQLATPASITFIADVDSDGTTERVEYTHDPDPPGVRREQWPSLAGADCEGDWSASAGAQPLVDKVVSLTFTYYDNSGTQIPDADLTARLGEIRRITIAITTSDILPSEGTRSYTLTSEVRPRNLGL